MLKIVCISVGMGGAYKGACIRKTPLSCTPKICTLLGKRTKEKPHKHHRTVVVKVQCSSITRERVRNAILGFHHGPTEFDADGVYPSVF